MTDSEHPPAEDGTDHGHLVSPHLVRNLALVLVIVVLGFGFGRPLAAGYYFGGCDEAEDTQHYVIHVFAVTMCRDVLLRTEAERSALHSAEATPLTEFTEEETEEERTSAPEGTSPATGGGEQART